MKEIWNNLRNFEAEKGLKFRETSKLIKKTGFFKEKHVVDLMMSLQVILVSPNTHYGIFLLQGQFSECLSTPWLGLRNPDEAFVRVLEASAWP